MRTKIIKREIESKNYRDCKHDRITERDQQGQVSY